MDTKNQQSGQGLNRDTAHDSGFGGGTSGNYSRVSLKKGTTFNLNGVQCELVEDTFVGAPPDSIDKIGNYISGGASGQSGSSGSGGR
jgi:hypothetical protein